MVRICLLLERKVIGAQILKGIHSVFLEEWDVYGLPPDTYTVRISVREDPVSLREFTLE
jgi:hypothetical protein